MESTTPKLLLKLILLLFVSGFLLFQLFPLAFLLHIPPLSSPTFIISSNPSSLFPKEAYTTKSGYLPVNSTTSSSIFYTFYEAQSLLLPDLSQTPLIIWLQGGLGCSSLFGKFMEIGPWYVNLHNHHNHRQLPFFVLEPNPGAWNREADLASPKKLKKSQDTNLQLPNTSTLPSPSESYAGKFVPAIGYYILKKNDELMMPDHDHDQSQILINLGGLINERQRIELEWHQQEAIRLAKIRHWREATNARHQVVDMLHYMTRLPTLYNYSKKAPYHKTQWVIDYLHNQRVALYEDNMKSVKYMVELLVKRSKVLLYQGRFDLWDGVYSTEAWVKTLQWEEIGNFLSAD
ncbi:unnamed protein product [Prunus armeniaca]|uniref:Uncharacterized protein n=1 Tax=Prunus armeniaca TaxID=36596 RepID=A0A6J5TNA8_PRUAR|nr:unnamed protein product [Prunus armeniaca]